MSSVILSCSTFNKKVLILNRKLVRGFRESDPWEQPAPAQSLHLSDIMPKISNQMLYKKFSAKIVTYPLKN